jgi:hypothetical protein
MRTSIPIIIVALLAFAADAEIRTWTFVANGKIEMLDGGAWSFRQGGRVEAEFIKLSKHNNTNIIILKMANAREGCVQLSCVSVHDQDYVAAFTNEPAQVTLQRERNLAYKAQMESATRRLQAEAELRRNAAELADQVRRREQAEREKAAAEEARFSRYASLWGGKPDSILEPNAYDYALARRRVLQASHSPNPLWAQTAREILDLADGVTRAKLAGFQNVADSNANLIKDKIHILLDAGILPDN